MALANIPCEHGDKHSCGGYLTNTEVRMHEMDPSRTAQEYHDVLELFEAAFASLNDSSQN